MNTWNPGLAFCRTQGQFYEQYRDFVLQRNEGHLLRRVACIHGRPVDLCPAAAARGWCCVAILYKYNICMCICMNSTVGRGDQEKPLIGVIFIQNGWFEEWGQGLYFRPNVRPQGSLEVRPKLGLSS